MSSGAQVRTLLRLAVPMLLARASQSVVTFADAFQVKHLGYEALAATATGGLNVMGFIILAWGTVFIVQSFVSQLAGRGERDEAPRYAWYGLAIAALAGVVAAALIPLVEPMLALTDYSPSLRAQMASYMVIRMLSIAAVIGVEALGSWYGGLGNTWMQMYAGLITMAAAVFFNWVLIDGHLGAPAMGVDGAALASTIASFLGFAFIAVAFWRRRGGAPRAPAGKFSLHELGRVIRFGLPNGFNWFLEFAAFQLFVNGMLAGLGGETVAALNVVLAVNSLSFMPAFGMASAGAILAGNAIGRDERAAVWPQVRTTWICTMTWMGAIAVVYVVFPHAVLTLFDSEHAGNLVAIGSTMLSISAAWQLGDATNMTLSEALRAAGDTTWTAAMKLVTAWVGFVPVAYFTVSRWHGGAVGAMLCLVGYVVLQSALLIWRFRTGKWQRIQLIEPRLV
ncbi:MAG TPA: MATE family efflux transporter [Kofleriaceae bacterium]|nr:MATE family efflux transporter [Kofleriaceae bacterium]